MSQVEAPRDCSYKRMTDAERKKAKAWVADEGWCSCCVRGLRWGKPVKVVHIGRPDMNVALCMTCLGKMTKAAGLQTGKGEP